RRSRQCDDHSGPAAVHNKTSRAPCASRQCRGRPIRSQPLTVSVRRVVTPSPGALCAIVSRPNGNTPVPPPGDPLGASARPSAGGRGGAPQSGTSPLRCVIVPAADSRPPATARIRRRDRHGRGLRGPLAPAGSPLQRTRSERFDDLVLQAVAQLEPRWGSQLGGVEVAVEEVPTADPPASDLMSDDSDPPPLARLR